MLNTIIVNVVSDNVQFLHCFHCLAYQFFISIIFGDADENLLIVLKRFFKLLIFLNFQM